MKENFGKRKGKGRRNVYVVRNTEVEISLKAFTGKPQV